MSLPQSMINDIAYFFDYPQTVIREVSITFRSKNIILVTYKYFPKV